MPDEPTTQTPEAGAEEKVFVRPTEPKRDAVKEKAAELRERLQRGESIFETAPGEPPAPPVEEPEPKPEPTEELEAREPVSEVDTDNLPEGFRLTDSGRIQGPDGKFWSQDQVLEHLNAGAEPAEPAEPAEEGAEEGAEDDVYTLQLPGRRPEDPDLEVPLEGLTEDEVEAFNRLRNGYARGEEAKRQLARAAEQRQQLEGVQAEIEDFRVGLQTDPVGYIMDNVPEKVRADLVRHILSDDGIYDEVVPDLAAWDSNQEVRARRKAELKAERLENQERAKSHRQRVRAARQNAKEIRSAIGAAGAELSEAEQDHFERLALREVTDYANQKGVDTVPIAVVRRLLTDAGTLRLFGISADALVAPAPNGANPEDDPVPSARPKGPAEERLVRRTSTSPDDGERFREKAARKRAATGTTPTGGPAPNGPVMRKGDTVKDRIEALKTARKRGGSIQSLLSGG